MVTGSPLGRPFTIVSPQGLSVAFYGIWPENKKRTLTLIAPGTEQNIHKLKLNQIFMFHNPWGNTGCLWILNNILRNTTAPLHRLNSHCPLCIWLPPTLVFFQSSFDQMLSHSGVRRENKLYTYILLDYGCIFL